MKKFLSMFLLIGICLMAFVGCSAEIVVVVVTPTPPPGTPTPIPKHRTADDIRYSDVLENATLALWSSFNRDDASSDTNDMFLKIQDHSDNFIIDANSAIIQNIINVPEKIKSLAAYEIVQRWSAQGVVLGTNGDDVNYVGSSDILTLELETEMVKEIRENKSDIISILKNADWETVYLFVMTSKGSSISPDACWSVEKFDVAVMKEQMTETCMKDVEKELIAYIFNDYTKIYPNADPKILLEPIYIDNLLMFCLYDPLDEARMKQTTEEACHKVLDGLTNEPLPTASKREPVLHSLDVIGTVSDDVKVIDPIKEWWGLSEPEKSLLLDEADFTVIETLKVKKVNSCSEAQALFKEARDISFLFEQMLNKDLDAKYGNSFELSLERSEIFRTERIPYQTAVQNASSQIEEYCK